MPTHILYSRVSVGRRMAVIIYEAFLVIALVFAAGFLAVFLARLLGLEVASIRFTQSILALALTFYFTWSWSAGRQTLAMKTWKVQLLTHDKQPVPHSRAFLRWMALIAPWIIAEGLRSFLELRGYPISHISHITWAVTAVLFPWVWSFFHPYHLPFHDALSGTELVHISSSTATPA